MESHMQIFYSMPLSALILERMEGNYVLIDINKAFTTAIGKKEEDLIGKSISEIFPENPEQHGTNWEQIYPSLEKVILSGEADSLKVLRFDVLNEDIGEFVERYWQIENIPIMNKLTGKVQHIQSIIIEKTSEVLGRKIRQGLEIELLESIEKGIHFFGNNSNSLNSRVIKGNYSA